MKNKDTFSTIGFALRCRWSRALPKLENLRSMITLKNISSVFSYKNRILEYWLKRVSGYSQISAGNQCSFIFNRLESVTQIAKCTCLSLCSSKKWEQNIVIHWNRLKRPKYITAQLKSSNKSLLLVSLYFFCVKNVYFMIAFSQILKWIFYVLC